MKDETEVATSTSLSGWLSVARLARDCQMQQALSSIKSNHRPTGIIISK